MDLAERLGGRSRLGPAAQRPPECVRSRARAGGGVDAVHADTIVFRILGPLLAPSPVDRASPDAVLRFPGAADTADNRQAMPIGPPTWAMV